MKRLIPLLVLVSLACRLSELSSTQIPSADPTYPSSSVVFSTATLAPLTPTVSPTLAPYEQYSIEYLRGRTYGGGNLNRPKPVEFLNAG